MRIEFSEKCIDTGVRLSGQVEPRRCTGYRALRNRKHSVSLGTHPRSISAYPVPGSVTGRRSENRLPLVSYLEDVAAEESYVQRDV